MFSLLKSDHDIGKEMAERIKSDPEGEVREYAKLKGTNGDVSTPEFKRWSNDAPVITSEAAKTHEFKSGDKVAVEAYHGTGRPDRVGTVFQKERATSGPMAFFTSDSDLASNYANGKSDTSLTEEDQNYSNWFKYQPKGQSTAQPIDRAWHALDDETKDRVAERMPDIRADDDGNVIYEKDGGDIGSYDWNLKQTQRGYDRRGNPLEAAVETWLNSGSLYRDEGKFLDVMRLAGMPMKDVTYDSPHETFPYVYKTYIAMQKPLVTSDIPAAVSSAFDAAAKADRSRAKYAEGTGADMWDKNTRTLKDWVGALRGDHGEMAWTSIPDKVTKLLESMGYDGIIDKSGKGGGAVHPVYIPFEETQVKSAIGNNGKFDLGKKRIDYSLASTVAGVKFPGNKLLSQAESRLSDLIDHGLDDIGAYGMVAPMSAGTQKTRALAQEYANQERLATYQWGQMETAITKHFDEAQRTKMWNAADEQNELMQQNLPTAGKGLDRLNPEERAAVEQLHKYGEELMLRAKAVGMFKGDGVPYWTPRMAVMLDANGDYSKPSSGDGKASSSDGSGRNFTTSASSLKQRKYLTSSDTEAAMQAKLAEPGQSVELVRDIRTMPLAMQKLEKAIAGRELVNQIKVLGKQIGKTLVTSTAAPGFFTIDHPAFTTFEPRMGEDAAGKYTALKDDQGDVIMDKKPIYISKDFEGPLKAILTQQDGAIYRGYMLLKSKAMSAIMVSPLTHNMVIAGRAFAYAGLKLPALYFTGHGARLDSNLMTNAISHGMVPISGANHSMVDVGDIARGFGKDGGWGDPNESWIGLGAKAIGNKIVPGMGSGMKRGVDAAGDFWHGTLLWNRIGDLQAGIFKDANNKALAKGLDTNAAATYAASVANRYAGAVGRENMSAIARKMANVVLFSRSFNMGNIGAVKDVFYGMPAGLKAQLMEGSSAASAELGLNMAKRKAFTGLVTDLAATVLITSVTQDWIRRNKEDPMAKQISDSMGGYSERAADMWSNLKEHPGSLGSYDPYRLSSTFHNEPGKTDRVDMGAQDSGRHEYMRLPTGKVVEDTIGWLTHPGDTFVKKMSPMAKATADIAMNNKGFGIPVWDESGTAGQKAMDIAMHLMQAQLPYDSARTGWDLANGVATPLDKKKLAGNMTGLSVSQGHPAGPEGALAAKVEERVTKSKAYAMEEVKRDLKYGDDEGARNALERVGLTPKEINNVIKNIENPRGSLSKPAQKRFNQHANEEEQATRAELER